MGDEAGIMVNQVMGGAVHSWNTQAGPDLQVRYGDWIMEVNGARGPSQDLLHRLKDEGSLKMWIKRPAVVRICGDTSLKAVGLVITYALDGSTLLIQCVKEGIVEDWNRNNPELTVRKHDRIVEVNGTTGCASSLMSLLRLQIKLELVIFCYNIQGTLGA